MSWFSNTVVSSYLPLTQILQCTSDILPVQQTGGAELLSRSPVLHPELLSRHPILGHDHAACIYYRCFRKRVGRVGTAVRSKNR